jgi:hypothetical protein
MKKGKENANSTNGESFPEAQPARFPVTSPVTPPQRESLALDGAIDDQPLTSWRRTHEKAQASQ